MCQDVFASCPVLSYAASAVKLSVVRFLKVKIMQRAFKMIDRVNARFRGHWRMIIAFAALILLAAGVRLLTFQRYLPYNDHVDEGNMLLLARDWRGVEKMAFIPQWLAGYPPLYVWINMGVQQVVEKLAAHPWVNFGDYYYALRFLSALSGIGTTLMVIWLGWLVAGPIAGWFAGLIWGIGPIIVEHNSFAIPDPLVYFACAASLAMALQAWNKRSPLWSFGSLIAAILAVYLKYPAAYTLIPWAIVTGILFWKNPRRFWCWCMAELVVGILAASYLVFGYGAFKLSNNEAGRIQGTGLAPMFNLGRNLDNALFAIWPIGLIIFFVILILGVATYFYTYRNHQRPQADWGKIGLLLLYSAAVIVVTSSYLDLGTIFPTTDDAIKDVQVRHVLPATLALCAVWGACIAQIANTLKAQPNATGYRRFASLAVVAGIGIVVGMPALVSTGQMIYQYHLPNTRYLLWRWTDANIPSDGLILMKQGGDAERTWNRYWSGYDGIKTFQWWWIDKDTFRTSPRQFFDRNIVYFVTSDSDRQSYPPEAAAFIDQLTLLKVIRSSSTAQAAGPTLYFYRMMPPQMATQATFGNQIALVGYDLSHDHFAPGETIHFRPYWRMVNHPEANYSMFVHLYPSGKTQMLAQFDGAPSTSARLPLTWDDPGELYIGTDAALTIPTDLAPGTYQLAIGLYDFSTGQRLQLENGQDTFDIPVFISTDVF